MECAATFKTLEKILWKHTFRQIKNVHNKISNRPIFISFDSTKNFKEICQEEDLI